MFKYATLIEESLTEVLKLDPFTAHALPRSGLWGAGECIVPADSERGLPRTGLPFATRLTQRYKTICACNHVELNVSLAASTDS